MYPTLIEFQGLGFHTWGLMIMMAFLAAFVVSGSRAPKVGIDPDRLVLLYLLAVVAGLGGSRLLHFMLAETKLFFSNPLVFFDPGQGGFAFLGGVIGGVLTGLAYCKVRGIHMWKLGDIAAAAIMIGLAVGRIGCFFAGCCHGRVCGLPVSSELLALKGGAIVTVSGFPYLALTFNEGVGVGAIFDRALFPTQLWEITAGLVLFLLLSWAWRSWRKFDGQILAMMLVGYAGIRATIEQFRGDSIRGVHDLGPVALSTSQLVAIGMVVAAVAITAWRLPKGVEPEAEFVPPDDDDDE